MSHYSLTVLPDRSILIGQKLLENAKIQIFKCDNLDDFQTLCSSKPCKKWCLSCLTLDYICCRCWIDSFSVNFLAFASSLISLHFCFCLTSWFTTQVKTLKFNPLSLVLWSVQSLTLEWFESSTSLWFHNSAVVVVAVHSASLAR